MKKLYTIGRDLQSDIVIEDPTDIISRLHATIRFDGSKMYIIDQSQNGTYVNGMRMTANEEVPVTRKDTVSFANVYDLDWNRLPDPGKDQMKKMWIAIVAILALILGAWAIYHFTHLKQQSGDGEPQTEITVDDEVTNDSVDVIAEEDSVFVDPKPEDKKDNVSTKDDTKKGNKFKDNKNKDNKNKDNKIGQEPKVDEKKEGKAGGDIPLY